MVDATVKFTGSDRYQIVRTLGTGGMGVVYAALDRERGSTVALKTLRHIGPAAIARFKREFRALADVAHPNLVNLYELVADDAHLFFTMELVNGVRFDRWVAGGEGDDRSSEPESASNRSRARSETNTVSLSDVSRAPRLPPPPTVPAAPETPVVLDLARLRAGLRQLAEGVAAIHAAGMLHRDLKPSNILVDATGRVVVLDFGLVTELADELPKLTEDRPLQGTFGYMSPEQGARAALTPASDWYSVSTL